MSDPRPTRASDEAFDASVFDNRAPSVGHLLRQRVADTPDNIAYSYPSGIAWDELTWAQLGERVWALAAGLVELGIEPEDRVALASSSRIEWVLSDYAIMAAGAATTTIYPTSISDDVAFITDDSGSCLLYTSPSPRDKRQSRMPSSA